MTLGAIPPVPLCLSVWFFTCSFFGLPFLSKKRGWNSGYKAVLSNKHQSSWVQFVHCSTVQSHQRSPAVGLLGSLEALPSRQALASLIRLCLAASCAWCLSRRWGTPWVGCCCLEDEGMCDKGRCDKTAVQSVAGIELVPKAVMMFPHIWGLRFPTVLTMAYALKSHRADQNYCCSNVLSSSRAPFAGFSSGEIKMSGKQTRSDVQ